MRRIVPLLLIIVLLCSCGIFNGSEIEAPTGDAMPTDTPEITAAAESPTPLPSGDGRFSLRYSAGSTLNPITGTSSANLALSTLMYEGLFAVLEDFSYEYVLCESFETSDAVTYVFNLREGLLMSDGSELTVNDVVYSINQARSSSRYKSRLSNIESVAAAGLYSVRIKLYEADSKLPLLLDVPIIQDGSSGTVPRGGGAYKYWAQDGEAMLIANEYYKNYSTLPVRVIYLVECADNELGEYFTEGKIDLFTDDPNAPSASVRRDHEVRYYNTTVMQYIGFNPRTSVISDSRFRAVIQLAVNRVSIVNGALGGKATASPLVFPPYYPLYDATWEPVSRSDTLVAMSEALGEIGMRDSNSDTFLEYPTDYGYIPFTLTFLVNEENDARTEAARQISDTLRRVGLNVVLTELPFDEYKTALEHREFDMYYGETKLSPSLDLSELVSPGGLLDYGGMGTDAYAELVSSYLGARSEFAERGAARDLCTTLARELPIIPIAYKQYAVHSGRNEIRGIIPSQTGLFRNIYEWTIDVK